MQKKSMLTLTKNIIKNIRSLEQKKGRKEQQSWIVEGNKSVEDILAANTFRCKKIIANAAWWDKHHDVKSEECYLVNNSEMERVSLQPSPQDVIAIFELPQKGKAGFDDEKLTILLDEIQDPGNLGTIIRTADWFGIREIICTPGTVDCFSPKVVQATMSALTRVRVSYIEQRTELYDMLKTFKGNIYGTFLEGENIYQTELSDKGILIMGNEGKGIGKDIKSFVSKKLLIPDFSPDGKHVESLNVSIATAICLSELKRR